MSSGERGWDAADDLKPAIAGERLDRLERPLPFGRVADDPSFSHLPLPDLELRLHQNNHVYVGCGRRSRRGERLVERRQNLSHGNEREIHRDQRQIRREVRRREVSNIEFVSDRHPWIRPEPPRQLPFPYIIGMDKGCASLKQAIGEAARRGAQVGAHAAVDGDSKMIEGGLELGAGSAGEWELMQNPDLGFRVDQLSCFFDLLLVDKDVTGQKQRLRFVPAFRNSAFDKQQVDASLHLTSYFHR